MVFNEINTNGVSRIKRTTGKLGAAPNCPDESSRLSLSPLSLLSLLLLLVFVIGQVFLSVFHWAAWTLVFDLLKGKKALTSRTISGLKRVLPL